MSADFETKKFACESFAASISYRRERRWQVFSWASSLLVGVVGGIFTLANATGVDLAVFQRIILSIAVGTITSCASLWIRRGTRHQLAEQDALERFHKELGIEPLRRTGAFTIGTRATLAILSLGALVAIWFTHPPTAPDHAIQLTAPQVTPSASP